ncbi:hypothetical protein diail_3083 [Diaporthe ilicicola]|nr:hypothetical protein diail_3083 [Diaporthe ilicicola]
MHIQIWHQPQPDERRPRQMPPVSKKTPARPTTDNTPRQHHHHQQPQQPQQQQQQQQQQQNVVSSPLKPQLHSRKCHHTYNATRHLPQAVWIRSARLSKDNSSTVIYEVVLCYDHNRACTVNRTWEDFQKLKSGLASWRNAPSFCSPRDIDGLQRFLCEAISKKGREVAMEFFLRRRMDDCGGA